ncbi:MAG: hypothetical protein NUV47_01220 [Patescibacteria group bacterium]|nr:hypothetical protein [Patescibacteria group bacterium]
MYDYNSVIYLAMFLKFKELAGISLEDYKILLLNFQQLMKHYDIKQPKINIGKDNEHEDNL